MFGTTRYIYDKISRFFNHIPSAIKSLKYVFTTSDLVHDWRIYLNNMAKEGNKIADKLKLNVANLGVQHTDKFCDILFRTCKNRFDEQ